ncbi:hypothetical protein Tco_0111060 [Tanacetum coccineum]
MNVKTLALTSRNCDFDHELEKVEVAHKVFDELPNGKVNPTSGGWFRELNGLKQISSVKEYYETFISMLHHLQLSPEYGLSIFVDGLEEEIQRMVRLFKPQNVSKAYYLAKIHELTLNFQAYLQFDAHNRIQSEEMLNSEISIALMENHEENNVGSTMGINNKDVEDIQELELNNVKEHGKVIEASMIKDKILRQPSSDFIVVSETFEWNPGLKSCSFERWRKIQHGLDKHGVVHMLRTRSLMLRAEPHLKYDYRSLKWHYLGRKFKSSRRLQGSVGNSFQENVKFLFGLNTKILKEENDWKAYDIHIPLPTGLVNNGKLNFCILLNHDADSREIETMDIVCSSSTSSKRSIRFILITSGRLADNLQFLVCALHIDSYDMKILECLFVSDSKTPLEPHVTMDSSLQFNSSKLTNEELISLTLQGTLLTDKRRPYLPVCLNKAVIQEKEASVADESLSFIIFETSLPCVWVPSIHFTAGIFYYTTRGKCIILEEVKRGALCHIYFYRVFYVNFYYA